MELEPNPPLTWLDRTLVAFIDRMGQRTVGYRIAFSGELVRRYGLRGFVRWARSTQNAWQRLVNAFGEEDTHLLAAFASLWNGCRYCAQGHLLAHNLHVLEHQQRLFPLDERDVLELFQLRDAEILHVLRQQLGGAYAGKLELLLRQHLLKNAPPGAVDRSPDPALDARLRQSIALYEWVNECSIVADEDPPPLGPIAREAELIARYRELQARQRSTTVELLAALRVRVAG